MLELELKEKKIKTLYLIETKAVLNRSVKDPIDDVSSYDLISQVFHTNRFSFLRSETVEKHGKPFTITLNAVFLTSKNLVKPDDGFTEIHCQGDASDQVN